MVLNHGGVEWVRTDWLEGEGVMGDRGIELTSRLVRPACSDWIGLRDI
jgi:hypothetical protein